ncbi:hypothetical protein MD484_g8950, partial [Candolleomyces efflorescens]
MGDQDPVPPQDPAPPPSSQCPPLGSDVNISLLTPHPPSTPPPIKLTPSLKPVPLPAVGSSNDYLGPKDPEPLPDLNSGNLGDLKSLIHALEQSPYVPTPDTDPVPLPPVNNPAPVTPTHTNSVPPHGLLLQPVAPKRQVHFEDDGDYEEETDDDGDIVMADVERQGPGRPSKEAKATLHEATREVNDLLYALSREVNESIEDLWQLLQAFLEGTESKGNLKFMRVPFHPIVMLYHGFNNAQALLNGTAERSGRTAASMRKAYFSQYTASQSGNRFNQYQAMKKTLTGTAGSSTEASKHGEKVHLQTLVLVSGDAIHNDAALVALHESSGAKGFFLELFNLDENGITGLLRIHASKKRAADLLLLGAEHAHSVQQENKHLIPSALTITQPAPSYPLKLSDSQLEALGRADTELEYPDIVVQPDPWDPAIPDTNQVGCDNFIRDYLRKVQATFDPSAPVAAAPFNTLVTTLIVADRCATNYPNRIHFPGELNKGKFNGICSLGRGAAFVCNGAEGGECPDFP